MWFRLAILWGCTLREAQIRCNGGEEFAEWMAVYSLEPWDAQIGMLAESNWMFANANRDMKKHPQPFKLSEFLPGKSDNGSQGQTPEEMNAVLARIPGARVVPRKEST